MPVLRIIMPGSVILQIIRHNGDVCRQILMLRPLRIFVDDIVLLIVPSVPAILTRQTTGIIRGVGIGQIKIIASFQYRFPLITLDVGLTLPYRYLHTIAYPKAQPRRTMGCHRDGRCIETIDTALMFGAERDQTFIERDLREFSLLIAVKSLQS